MRHHLARVYDMIVGYGDDTVYMRQLLAFGGLLTPFIEGLTAAPNVIGNKLRSSQTRCWNRGLGTTEVGGAA